MGQSYRIRTEIGVNKTINLNLEQDFEFLEILSLKIQQTDIYLRSCSNYGVLVGRVTANNGFGLPNARVSIFIPIETIDESNPILSSIYPYKSPSDKNEDGYRYNLLPYEKSYSTHAATGTLPSRVDALTGATALELYDKYYKFTAKTNESGDYMIMGVPLGNQTVVMDVDLSDIGEFSLTPQDLIRMGIATEAQVAGGRFKTSTDLGSLPQIVNLSESIEISPLWGDPSVCQIAVNRLDFDLRDQANIDIRPTSVFMGSIYSTSDKYRVRKNCRPKDNMGNLCSLTTSPGQVLAIRQTIDQDSDGNPVLEQFELEQSGNIIDGSGTWITELPMNLDYYITNEFGEKVLSNDPSIGIPTKSKYRFKVKWQQPNDLTIQTRRPYYLVPNVKEYGWSNPLNDPINSAIPSTRKKLASSYYFGLAWSGYTDGFFGNEKTERLNDCINGEDTFYEFKFNRVYTISSLIDQYKKGRKGRFIGIKEIDDDSCEDSVNKFPVNDGFRNFDFLYFLFAILMIIIQPIGLILLTVAHIILFLYNLVIKFFCELCKIQIPIIKVYPFRWLCSSLGIKCDKKNYTLRLPMITYPDCQACECKSDYDTNPSDLPSNPNTNATGVLTYLSAPEEYYDNFSQTFSADTNGEALSIAYSEAIAGRAEKGFINNSTVYKLPLSQNILYDGPVFVHASSKSLPIGERINIFNGRKKYFDNINKIKVQVEPNLNIGKHHYDNTITVLSNQQLNAGDVITMVDISNSMDSNWLYSASTANGLITGISGTSYTTTAATTVTFSYATSETAAQSVLYNIPYGSEPNNYKAPSDVEYFQVVTAITWGDIINLWNPNTIESFPNILYTTSIINQWRGSGVATGYDKVANTNVTPIDYYSDISSQYVLILQRGVDPYSPKYIQKYQLGNLFGTGENDPNFTITATTRLNIPVQPNSNLTTSIQGYNQNEMYFQSYFFSPGIVGDTTPGLEFSGYSTVNTGYYGLLDSQQTLPTYFNSSGNKVVSKTSNSFFDLSPNSSYYDLSEDLSGLSAMGGNDYNSNNHPWNNYLPFFDMNYYSKTIYQGVPWSALTISDRTKNILRTDRLPSSDKLDGGNWGNNPSLLQQNLTFNFNLINLDSDELTTQPFSTGADIPTADLSGLTNDTKVIESFSCEKMVGLDCYQGFGSSFEINQNCTTKDAVENGCYMFIRRLILDIPKDWGNFTEWSFRFRFFYGLCRGVLSQSFANNWVNGSLYMFPIQVDTFFDKQNKPLPPIFCKQIAYFDDKTNNFYYRSSPYNENINKFIGMRTNNVGSVNTLNLLFPTTVINLGMKDSFYGEITFDPDTKAYILPNIDSTSYGDTSDLVNLFVISRITDEGFLQQIISFGDNSLDQLFSRPERRIDGDLAQLMSINSEIGNISFSPEFYETTGGPPATILGTQKDPIVAVWFSSTTQDLQTKDYLTPGRIDFRGPNNVGFYPYPYGIKSQVVPFYQWRLDNTATIFGNQKNNWATNSSDIIQNTYYQGLDRASLSTKYFLNQSSSVSDLNARGYIFSVDSSGNYISTGAVNQSFLVGAPFHFYFGVVKGESALDKFKTKYSIGE